MPNSIDAPGMSGDQPTPVRRAVILAAGKGTRLLPLTAEIPKCLVAVGGRPLLERALEVLASQGVAEAVIVIGHKGEVVRARLGSCFAGVDIRYVEAPDFETTNSIRSLWDAREYLDQDLLLLEADVAFDPEVISALLMEPGNSAAVAPYHPALSGTMVRRDDCGCVTSFMFGAGRDAGVDLSDAFKTVNIYLLRKQLLREQVVPRLRRAIEAGHVDRYCETVLRDCVADGSLTDLAAVDVSASRWYEIDDHRDREAAELVFAGREAQLDRVSG